MVASQYKTFGSEPYAAGPRRYWKVPFRIRPRELISPDTLLIN